MEFPFRDLEVSIESSRVTFTVTFTVGDILMIIFPANVI